MSAAPDLQDCPPPLEAIPLAVYDEESSALPTKIHVARLASEPAAAVSAAEQSVLGSLMFGGSLAEVSHLVCSDDYSPAHRLILEAIKAIAARGEPHDQITVSEQLKSNDHLVAAGGLAYLSELARNTPTASSLPAYALAVRERALRARLPSGYRDDDSIASLKRDLAQLEALKARAAAPSIVLRHVADIVDEHREAQWLNGLVDILERYVLAVLAGPRNTLKSFVADHWAMLAVLNGEAVVILNAEGAGLGRRIEAWMRCHAPAVDLKSLRLLALERAVNLNSPAVLKELRAAIDATTMTPALIVIDTMSKYAPGLKENDSETMSAFIDSLSRELRDHYGASVLVVAHSGHGDPGRPRGSSALMANPDAEFITQRATPTTMAVAVSRDRYKDSPALPPLAYIAEVVDLDRRDGKGRPVTSLILRDTDVASVVTRREPKGANQQLLLGALREHARASSCEVISTMDLMAIGKAQKINRKRIPEVRHSLERDGWIAEALGGIRLLDAKP